MPKPDPKSLRYLIHKTSDGFRHWMDASVVIEPDGELLHVFLRSTNGAEFRCQGEMNRRMGRATGMWDPRHEFVLKVQTKPSGPARLYCEVHELPDRMTSDSWSADEDGP